MPQQLEMEPFLLISGQEISAVIPGSNIETQINIRGNQHNHNHNHNHYDGGMHFHIHGTNQSLLESEYKVYNLFVFQPSVRLTIRLITMGSNVTGK